jgi:hypothetical protein
MYLNSYIPAKVIRAPGIAGKAAREFDQALARGRRGDWWGGIRFHARLCRLSDAPKSASANQHAAGLQLIPLSRIVGTEDGGQDFDANFNPISERVRVRWLSVYAAREAGLALPPVDLVQVGGRYYVRDGHHRISVACARGQREIEANVTRWG